MLRYAIITFIIALVAGALGFGGIAAGAEYLAGLFLIIFLVLLVLHVLGGRKRV